LFCQIISKYHDPYLPAFTVVHAKQEGYGDVKTGSFPVQNIYKMTYGAKDATFEPLNL